MSRRFRFCAPAVLLSLVVALLTLGGVPSAVADTDTATVHGKITAPVGEGFYWVFVTFAPAGQQPTSNTRIYDSSGNFEVSVPEGAYDVYVSSQLYPNGGPSSPVVSVGMIRKNVVVTDGMSLTFDVPATPVTMRVHDTSGAPVTALTEITCTATSGGDQYNLSSTITGTDPIAQWGLPGSAEPCDVAAVEGSGETVYGKATFTVTGSNSVSLVVPQTNRVQGFATVADPEEFFDSAMAYRSSDGVAETASNEPLPGYAVDVDSGNYALAFSFTNRVWGLQRSEFHWAFDVDATEDTTRNFSFAAGRTTLHFVDAGGAPVRTLFLFECSRAHDFYYKSDESDSGTQAIDLIYTDVSDYGFSSLPVDRPAADDQAGWKCFLAHPGTDPANWDRVPLPVPVGDDMTIVLPQGVAYGGDPASAGPGDDGVPSLTEALGPNHGDGNGDGVADADQSNVTSLPANGAAYSEGVPYLTLVGPAGSTLRDVSTSSTTGLPDPPEGATVPSGLSSFKLTGVAPGLDQTISIYRGDLTGMNGYAKWDGAAWSLLPGDRVANKGDHLEVRLTDGGEGDADHAANGTIVDPGGVAKVLPSDSTAPTVTGTPTTQPNAAGWYRGNVKVHWTASDPSGVAAQPADTVVSNEGSNVTAATSGPVCDKVTPTPNCGTGSLTVKIDKTAPSLAVTGVSNGATYTLGNVPGVGCSATDALSGLVGACKGVKAGGNSAGVGAFGYAAAVSDKAGNSRAAAAAWNVVYGFGGFAAPLNDPAVTPGTSTSIFKAGSTVPVAFSLKRANGQVATTASKPTWVSPMKGAKTTAAVNEAVSNAAGTSGSSFVWRNGRWEFNWATKGLAPGYLYKVGVKLDDGTTHYLDVGLR